MKLGKGGFLAGLAHGQWGEMPRYMGFTPYLLQLLNFIVYKLRCNHSYDIPRYERMPCPVK